MSTKLMPLLLLPRALGESIGYALHERSFHDGPIRTLLFALILCCLSISASATSTQTKPPKQLLAQVRHLSELLRDSHAVLYPQATLMQLTRKADGETMALVVFTLEGWGGGNLHTQYLAAFAIDTNKKGSTHFMLIDVIPIGGKGWRGIERLGARISHSRNSAETAIAIDAKEVSGDDAPNFPSKPVTIQLVLIDGRLIERPTTKP